MAFKKIKKKKTSQLSTMFEKPAAPGDWFVKIEGDSCLLWFQIKVKVSLGKLFYQMEESLVAQLYMVNIKDISRP